MFVWRFCKYDDLSGRGGLAASGRWHTKPKPIVYCADEVRTAHLEILRQIGHPSLIPDDMKLLRIEIPDRLAIEEVGLQDLDPRWSDRTEGPSICRPIGDRWFAGRSSAVLKVPSAARKGSSNYLLNTTAEDIRSIGIARVFLQPFAEELLR